MVRVLDEWSARSTARLGAIQVFRPRTTYLVTGFWAVVAVVWLYQASRFGFGEFLAQIPFVAFVSTAVYATCGRPLVAVRPHGVLLRNVVRDVVVPWGALDQIGTQYALTLTTTDGRRFTAWAAPAASRFSTTRATPSDLKSVQWDDADGPIPASASLRSDSGAAAAVVRRIWNHAKDAGPAAMGPTAAGPATVIWVMPVIATLAGTLVATVLSIVLA